MHHPLSRLEFKAQTGQTFLVGQEEFTLGGAVGDGAAGIVRKATRSRDGAMFAVKFVAPDPSWIEEQTFDDVAVRFRREGERGSRLEHPSLVRIHSYCDNDQGFAFTPLLAPRNPFLVMEYLHGKTLDSFIRHTPEERRRIFDLTMPRMLIALQIASALEYLHKRKIIHRDIKPGNIFFATRRDDLPRVKIGDFGIVKWGDFHSSISTGVLTATNQKGLGTLKYMAPEQAINAKEVTVRSDIYSLGLTLFELFTGQVLAGPHHAFEIMMVRLQQGTASHRYRQLGCTLHQEDEGIAAMILDMHLRGGSGRPSIEKVRGNLEWEWERRFSKPWQHILQ